jgi:simple sugar transport system substrate-binding protein
MNKPVGFTRLLLGIGAVSALTLTACSQGSSASNGAPATASAAASAAAPSATVPAAFAAGKVHIALVRQLSAGDYYEQWLAGAQREAKALNVSLDVSSADTNNDRQALNLQQAINSKADAVIVDHGFQDTMAPSIAKAVAANIPVVAFDVDAGSSKVISLDQSDAQIATQSLSVLRTDTSGTAKVIYVYVAGYAPLDKRNTVWEQFKKDNPGIDQVAKIGVVNSSTAAAVADQAKAALQANPGVTAIFAPYDDFAKGAVQAINELGLAGKVKVYGADISTADIGVITAANSPWVATSATDPGNVGAVAVRAAALRVAGLPVADSIEIPPTLISQQQLRDGKIANIAQLAGAIPALTTPSIAHVPWVA